MSWAANRFQRNRERRFLLNEAKEKRHRWINRRGFNEEDLDLVFRYPDFEYVLRVCERISRIKGRDFGPSRRHCSSPALRLNLPGRSRHHLTPGSQKGKLFHGEERRNILILCNGRHRAWHNTLFGNQTLEEIIFSLKQKIEARQRGLERGKGWFSPPAPSYAAA